MMKNDRLAHDAFTFSLGGMRTTTSFAMPPAIAHDRLRQDRENQVPDTRQRKWRVWMPRRSRVT